MGMTVSYEYYLLQVLSLDSFVYSFKSFRRQTVPVQMRPFKLDLGYWQIHNFITFLFLRLLNYVLITLRILCQTP